MSETKPFTKEDAAKAVKRTSIAPVLDSKTKKPVLDDAGRVKTQEVDVEVKASEVLSFTVRDGAVTVVTTDGQKLTGKVA